MYWAMCRRTEQMVQQLQHPKEGSKPLEFSALYSRSIWQQYIIILRKNLICYWRLPQYNAMRLFFTIIFAFVIGSVYYQLGEDR